MLFSESAVYGALEGVANRACCSLPSLSGAGLSCSTKQLQRRATGQRVQSCGQELADEETRHIQRWHDGLLRDMSPVLLVSFLMLKVMMHTFRLMGNPWSGPASFPVVFNCSSSSLAL